MNPSFTPEQNKQLASWAAERDAILTDIGNKKTEKEKLTTEVKDLAESKTLISNDIQRSIGRLEELDRQEINRATFVLRDVADLDERKSVLQTEISSLEKEIDILTDKKDDLNADVEVISKVYESIFSRASEMERIISGTVKISSTNASDIKAILVDAGIELKKIIDIGQKNVEVTNRIINEIPKIIVDIHRDVIERRKIPRAKPLK